MWSSTWNLDTGYDESEAVEDAFPIRVLGHGSENGVVFLLQGSKSDFDYAATLVQGFKVYLKRVL